MQTREIARVIAGVTSLLVLLSPLAFGAIHDGQVSILFPPDTRECTFFQLSGVTEADPVVPGNPWFAVPKTHLGYKEIFVVLLTARSNGRTITVQTDGTTACGHAAVLFVTM